MRRFVCMLCLLFAGFVLSAAAAIGEAVAEEWAVADMKKDRNTVFSFEK